MKRLCILMLALLPITAAAQAESVLKRGTGAVASGSSFTFGLFQEIAAYDDGNIIFISPLSASLALSMTAVGADGTTQEEMISTLGHDCSIKELNAYNKSVMAMLSSNSDGVVLNVANSLWISDQFPAKKKFIKTVKKNYAAEAANLDFSDPSSPSVINRWCADNTAGRIDKMLDRIEPNMVMYLLNALYFKGDWQVPFDGERTREDVFHGDDADSRVRFMHNTEHFHYYIGAEGSMLEMPYGEEGDYVMDVLLPGEGVSVDEFVSGLDEEGLAVFTGLLQFGKVKVTMPSFKAEYETSLVNYLKHLGMTTAFTASADFSGISKDPLMISDVRQKTFIEVNEKGSEAAAVTSVSVMRTTALPPDYAVFTVDRPFVFLIRERATGTVLFLGMVRNL